MVDHVEDKSIRIVARYNGKPLTEFSKEELIQIIEHMAAVQEGERRRHESDLRVMAGVKR